MKRVKFKTDKGLMTFDIAERWDELTLDQLIKVEKKGTIDPLEMFCILTGMDLTFLDNQKESLEAEVFDIIQPLFRAAMKQALHQRPARLLISGKAIEVPRPDKATLGQSIMFMNMVESSKDIYELVPDMLAIYFQPLIHGGPFDRTRLKEAREEVMKAPGMDCISVFSFFLSNQRRWKAITTDFFRLLNRTSLMSSLTMKRKYLADSTGLMPLLLLIQLTNMMTFFSLNMTLQ